MEQLPILRRTVKPDDLPGIFKRAFERELERISRNRRLAKDFEQTIASATAWLFIASIQLFARRIARV